jgi:thiol-disulfide isomerase/thioredoxin
VYKNKQLVKGSLAVEAYSEKFKNYFFRLSPDYNKSIQLFQEEMNNNPKFKSEYWPHFLEISNYILEKQVEVKIEAQKAFDEILNSGNNQKHAYKLALLVSASNPKKVDSMMTLVSNKFPQGLISAGKMLNKISKFNSWNSDSIMYYYHYVLENFPNLSENQKRRLNIELLGSMVSEKNLSECREKLNTLKSTDNTELLVLGAVSKFNSIATNFLEIRHDTLAAKEIYEFSAEILSIEYSDSKLMGETYELLSRLSWAKNEKQNAIKYQRKMVEIFDYLIIESNQILVDYLFKNNEFENARRLCEEIIPFNVSNSKIDSIYLETLKQLNYSELLSKEKLNALKISSIDNYESIISKKIISKNFENFDLPNLANKIVSTSEFKGSAIVLDFWATWCGPCIRGFPTMRKLMKDNESVKFLFINCLETENGKGKINRIENIINKYNLNELEILIDEDNEKSKSISNKFQIESLPTKVIIDREGRIRYQHTGFSTDENLEKEIRTVLKIIEEDKKQ